MTLSTRDESEETSSTPVRSLRSAPGNDQHASASDRSSLAEAIAAALSDVDAELGAWNRSFQDPERRKALSRLRDFLLRLHEGLHNQRDGVPLASLLDLV